MRMTATVMMLLLIFCSFTWADESDLVWSTFLGGSGNDYGQAVAVDDSGNTYACGYTYTPEFPTTMGAFDTVYNGYCDVFITKFNALENTLKYSTFLGGDSTDIGYGIAVDGSANAYVTGYTHSIDFPTTAGAFDTTYYTYSGYAYFSEIFVVKINTTGNHLVYATFIGGMFSDKGYDIAVDDYDNAYITGFTESSSFPTTAGAFDRTINGNNDVFLTRINAAGSALAYSTFLGGNSMDNGYSIAVDKLRNAYVTGKTQSNDFPCTIGAFDYTYNGDDDIFVAKLNPTGSALAYATFLGGSGWDEGRGIAVDSSNNAYVTGWTWSYDFPFTAEAYDTTQSGGDDVFISKLNALGSDLVYSTFLGGSEWEGGYGIAVDDSGNAYLTGYTYTAEFPTTIGAFDITHNGDFDVFITRLNDLGNNLDYSTFLGGILNEEGYDITVDCSGDAYITGYTESANFPFTKGAYDTTHNGSYDAFVAKLDIIGRDLTPPETIDDLVAELIARLDKAGKSFWGHICLSWTEPYDSSGIDHYIIYRSDDPNSFVDSIATTTATIYTDTGAAGNPIINYFYTVKAVDGAGNKAEVSNMVGEFDKPWYSAE